jgi:Kef-type K+ transport system membrane component KefB
LEFLSEVFKDIMHMSNVIKHMENIQHFISTSALVHHPLFAIGMLLVFGYFIGLLAEKIGLPEITGYLVAGLLLGKSLSGVITPQMEHSLKVVTEVALSFIALTIGGEFYWIKLKKMGKNVVVITIAQIVATFAMVTIGLYLFNMDLAFAMLLGAIASATAPAATVAIVQSLRAKGKFIDYLYGVVALDDAGAVILFGIVFAVATTLLGSSGASVGGIIFGAVMEVVISIVLGILSGFLIHHFTKKMKNSNEILLISLGIILLFTSVAIIKHLSPLLLNMAAGAVLINLSAKNHRIFRILEPLTPPIYALFFVIAGTELQLNIIFKTEILTLGIVYIVARAIGKYGGVYLGAVMCKADDKIKTNLGFCMLPQAGVALGLVLLIKSSPVVKALPADKQLIISTMVNIVLFSVFVNELIGPPISKKAIIRGNDMEI